ncbi:hypothetical protein ACJX0J_023496, partial [Zea mays]
AVSLNWYAVCTTVFHLGCNLTFPGCGHRKQHQYKKYHYVTTGVSFSFFFVLEKKTIKKNLMTTQILATMKRLHGNAQRPNWQAADRRKMVCGVVGDVDNVDIYSSLET